MDNEFIQKMVVLIEENLEEASLTPDWVAEKLGLSKTQLYRKMKALSDQSVSELIKAVRMHRAAELLSAGELTVSEISFKLGFSEQSNFSRSFYNHFGKYPTQYLKEKKP
ncbi:MAG: helix-turn-helix transcriptional regulator [Bacteroidales bacterium]|nr:helix-turn-helix transcriptional regulator [Bacteroidales bacterium]